MNANVLVLDEDFAEYQQLLTKAGVPADGGADPAAFGGGYDVLLAQPELAAAYLAQGGEVQWIQSTWAGVDELVPVARDRNLVVTGIKDVFGPQMAEYVFAFLLQQSRSLEYFRAEQSQARWSPKRPHLLRGQAMTILGTGTIGCHLAEVAGAFGMQTRGVSRSGRQVSAFDQVYSSLDRVRAVTGAQVLVNTLPSTPDTRAVLDSRLLNAMAPAAWLFNLGRGDAVCESSLKDWLDHRSQSIAVLDVFSAEPLPADHWLWGHPRVRVTPHVAAVSFPADVVDIFLGNLQRWQSGEPLCFAIDLKRGY